MAKHPGGRPKVNPEDYNVNWKKDVINAYKDGNSDIWVRCYCFNDHHISNDLWYRWIDEVDEFSEVINQGRKICQSWWENLSKEHASGNNTDANATSIIFNMSNRFRNAPRGEENLWKQRQTVEQTTKHSLDFDDLDKLQEFLSDNGVDISKIDD